MRVGISLTSNHAVKDPRDGARWMIERAAAARQSGLDSLFVGDHHATPAPHYQNVPILGRLVIAVVNFPPKQIGPFLSEVLVVGAYDAAGDVILLHPDSPVAPGSKIG